MADEVIKQNYEMFKRVLAFTVMNKDVINQYPQ